MKNSRFLKVLFLSIIFSFFLMSFSIKGFNRTVRLNSITELIMKNFIEDVTEDTDTIVDDGGCQSEDAEQLAKDRALTFSLDKTKMYALRDDFLKKNKRGLLYVESYYYASDVKLDYTKFSNVSLTAVMNIVPEILKAYDNIGNPAYKGIIVNTTLANSLKSVLTSYRTLSVDVKYIAIIDNLILDLKQVENKNKADVIAFMNK